LKTYKLLIEYDGTNLHGWQIQPDVPSVQGAIEDALAVVLPERTTVIGSGRTDAGVHARGQVAHFCLSESTDCWKLRGALNGLLPRSIRVLDLVEVSNDFHARFSATRRTYHYHVSVQPRALDAATRWVLKGVPNFEAMNEAAQVLVGTHDFSAFCRIQSETKNRVCTVVAAQWSAEERPGDWVFRISADRFLHGMVRTIVGTLMQVGYEKIAVDEVECILASRDRRDAGQAAPARGLVLQEVEYP
jgi:tRNA pseudouridine38-40 synthase